MLRESNRARFQTEQTSGSVVVEKVFEEVLFVSAASAKQGGRPKAYCVQVILHVFKPSGHPHP